VPVPGDNTLSKNVGVLSNPEDAIISLPQLPPQPEPLGEWYASEQVNATLRGFQGYLTSSWNDFCDFR
jgi:hypothetical protein